MRLKLPAFKVTQRTAASSTVRRNLPRGRKCESAPAQSSSGIEEGVPDFVSMMEEGPHACSVPEVSLHAVKEKAAATAWARVRPALLKIAVEGNAMPSDQSCIMCPEAASCRCIQCAPWAFYCQDCFEHVHSSINLFHIGEVWKVS